MPAATFGSELTLMPDSEVRKLRSGGLKYYGLGGLSVDASWWALSGPGHSRDPWFTTHVAAIAKWHREVLILLSKAVMPHHEGVLGANSQNLAGKQDQGGWTLGTLAPFHVQAGVDNHQVVQLCRPQRRFHRPGLQLRGVREKVCCLKVQCHHVREFLEDQASRTPAHR